MDLLFPPDEPRVTATAPLAERMRPRGLDEFVGQMHIVGQGTLLRRSLDRGELIQSMILWAIGVGQTY